MAGNWWEDPSFVPYSDPRIPGTPSTTPNWNAGGPATDTPPSDTTQTTKAEQEEDNTRHGAAYNALGNFSARRQSLQGAGSGMAGMGSMGIARGILTGY